MRTVFCLCSFFIFTSCLIAEIPSTVIPPLPPVPERGPARCLRCHGTGKLTKDKSGIKWSGSAMKSFQVECLTCNGNGKLVRAYTPAERLELQERRLAQMANEQLSNGNLPIGAAYLPAAELEALSPEDHAAIAREYPLTCEDCFGLGYACCETCEGTGKKEDKKEKRQRNRHDDPQDEKHQTAANDKSSFASTQAGKAIACDDCFGKGKLPCDECTATGLREICKKCSGTGLEHKPARRKRPASVELCRRCKGNGRR